MPQLFIYAGALVALVVLVQRQRVLARRVRRLERRQATGLRALDTRHVVTIRSMDDLRRTSRAGG